MPGPPLAVPGHTLDLLAATSSDPESLDLLIRGQHTRRLLLLRSVLDATQAADPDARARFRDQWDLLEAAERSGQAGRENVRRALQYPLVGPWAQLALSRLGSGRTAELGTFGAIAAAAAVRTRLSFRVCLTAGAAGLHLPGLGLLACAPGTTVDVRSDGDTLRLRTATGPGATVHPQAGHGAWSSTPDWRAAHALPPLAPGMPAVALDDQSPYRDFAGLGTHAVRLDDAQRKRWYDVWGNDIPRLLRCAGPHQPAETGRLLTALIPVAATAVTRQHNYYSGTRSGAFGCTYSSLPPGSLGLAEMLVHETQHAKLSALADLVTLHHEPSDARYFAPWRPDPRPLDGLWHGLYSHLALALWWLGHVQGVPAGPGREEAWARYALRREQITAALGQLVGSRNLTPEGRRFADGMVAARHGLDAVEPPQNHVLRARAYVATSRELWSRRLQR